MGRRGIIKTFGLKSKRKHNRVKYLQRKYETMYDKGIYNKNQYKRFVHVVSSNYMMTRDQRKQAKYIIDQFNFNELFCSNNKIQGSWETIVTAICFYVMKKDNSRRPLPYNHKFVRSVSLTKHIYDRIIIETSVSHANKSRIGDLCSDIITNTTGDYDYR